MNALAIILPGRSFIGKIPNIKDFKLVGSPVFTGTMLAMRVYGFEVEYAAVFLPAHGQRSLSHDEIANALFTRVREWAGGHDIFLPNGGRLYIDTGAHPEYATPECISLYDLVTQDRAGDLLLRQLAGIAEERLRAKGISGKLYVLRNNTDDHGNSWGCHENLMLRRSVPIEKLVPTLAPYMATRPIWAGAGGMVPTEKGIGYTFSPRIQYIEEISGTSTSQGRPLVNLRDEAHASSEFRRLHLLSGDTNMSEVVNFVKMGATAAILTLLERRKRFPDISIDPVHFMHQIAGDFEFTARVELPSGAKVGSIDIQEMYLEVCEREMGSGIFDEDVERAVRMWRSILDALKRRDWAFLETRIDWVRKRRLLDAVVKEYKIPYTDPKARFLDFAYHSIDGRIDAYEKLAKIVPAVTLVSKADVAKAVSSPPPGRATARGTFVSEVLNGGKSAIIDWERWGYEGEDEMWEVLNPMQDDAGLPILKTPALWESKSAVQAARHGH